MGSRRFILRLIGTSLCLFLGTIAFAYIFPDIAMFIRLILFLTAMSARGYRTVNKYGFLGLGPKYAEEEKRMREKGESLPKYFFYLLIMLIALLLVISRAIFSL